MTKIILAGTKILEEFIMIGHRRVCFIILLVKLGSFNVTITLCIILNCLTICILSQVWPLQWRVLFPPESAYCLNFFCPTLPSFLERTSNRNFSAHRFINSSIFAPNTLQLLCLHLYWWVRQRGRERVKQMYLKVERFFIWRFLDPIAAVESQRNKYKFSHFSGFLRDLFTNNTCSFVCMFKQHA